MDNQSETSDHELPTDLAPSANRSGGVPQPPKAPFMRRATQSLLHKLATISPGGWVVRPKLHRMRGVTIGEHTWISLYVYLEGMYPQAVTIGSNCSIGVRTSIFAHIAGKYAGPVIIEDDVFIGPHCVILPNVRIGKGAVIRAGTVVTRNVPPGVLWGPPAAGPLGRVTVPIVDHDYAEFVAGIRPIRKPKRDPNPNHSDDPTQ